MDVLRELANFQAAAVYISLTTLDASLTPKLEPRASLPNHRLSAIETLRSAGIPARAVSGYYGGTWSRAGYHVVRAGDAHSWVEVYFPGYGFLPFDPTPASERGGREASTDFSNRPCFKRS